MNGLNLSCYCLNNPIMYVDYNGNQSTNIILAIIWGIQYVTDFTRDIGLIISGTQGNKDGVFVDYDKTTDSNVNIHNSYLIKTSVVKYAYSIYLNYFNSKTKHIIDGSSMGVMYEWLLHNGAAWLGLGGESAKDLDVGKSIFADGQSHPLRDEQGNITLIGVMSLAMRLSYIMFFRPEYWIFDFIVNGGF